MTAGSSTRSTCRNEADADPLSHAGLGPGAALCLSFRLALIAALFNLVFGVLLAWVPVRSRFPGRRLLDAALTGFALAGLCIVLAFGANSAVGVWLVDNGCPIVFAMPGIILATMFVTFPFVARELTPVMIEQGRAEEEAALTLGAGVRDSISA